MRQLLESPLVPELVKPLINETAKEYDLFKTWLFQPFENLELRCASAVLFNSERHDCSDLSAQNDWFVRANAFDLWLNIYMVDFVKSTFAMAPLLAFRELTLVLNNPKSKPSEKIKAAEIILDRTGFGSKSELAVRKVSDKTPEDMTTMELVELIQQSSPLLGTSKNESIPSTSGINSARERVAITS